ncbi:Mut7-C RNAse domain-containing protein [Massilia sp. R2A-15]|uniref:Mut7-C RNAse domain-containing protein n=1 Tax=Massilia sp. R2A-15 TaxID=3064278 RepID=UPI002734D1CB|nr:Mut7-C RNAse domain-containing protein [Massilia sp. R2A-15]WLI87788.1 Mut7-C RNAse domain-containing protein [Massilia sp. R2A-15]
MACATFRFYGELNAFLAPVRRQKAFEVSCARNATVKHMVEALGVPHTEVALALLNGEAAPLDRLLQDGDRLAVYPRFAQFGVGAPQPPAWRFVADAHLGGLARMLRMAGFDTLYDNHFDDDTIVAIAAGEERVVLTRDRELLKRRGVGYGRYVHALRPAQQLAEVVERLALAPHAAPFTICLHCNAPLHDVAKELVQDRLPASVRAHQQEFSTCDQCGRVYWKGSHWKRMCALLDESLAQPDFEGSDPPGQTLG